MGSYRMEKREVMKIALANYDGALDPIPTSAPGHAAEPKLGRLSNVQASAGRPQAILLRSGAMRPARFWSSTRQHAATEDCVRATSLVDSNTCSISWYRRLGRRFPLPTY